MQKLPLVILLSALVSTTAFANVQDSNSEHASAKTTNIDASKAMMDNSMTAMAGMHTLQLTGDPDLDFIAGMLPHHQGAIVMSEAILPKLSDSTVHQLAVDIIKSQQQEVSFMKQWLATHKELPKDQRNIAHSKEMMTKSMNIMHKMMEVKLTGDANVDFVAGMLPHHQAAVEMVKVIQPYLKDQSTKTFAENIVKAQLKEITFMQSWLKNNPPAASQSLPSAHDHH